MSMRRDCDNATSIRHFDVVCPLESTDRTEIVEKDVKSQVFQTSFLSSLQTSEFGVSSSKKG